MVSYIRHIRARGAREVCKVGCEGSPPDPYPYLLLSMQDGVGQMLHRNGGDCNSQGWEVSRLQRFLTATIPPLGLHDLLSTCNGGLQCSNPASLYSASLEE